jgi:O-antigen ligase
MPAKTASKAFKKQKQPINFWEISYFIIILIFILFPFFLFLSQKDEFDTTYKTYFSTLNIQFYTGYFAVLLIIAQAVLALFAMPYKGFRKKIKPWLKNNIPLLIFCVFGILMVISTFRQIRENNYNFESDGIWFGTQARMEGLYTYLLYLMIFYMASCIKNDNLKRILLYVFMGLGVFIAYLTTQAQINLNNWVSADFWGVYYNRGVFLNSNHYGYYIAMVFGVLAIAFLADKPINKGPKLTLAKVFDFELEKGKKLPSITLGAVITKLLCAGGLYILFLVIQQVDALGTFLACVATLGFAIITYAIVKGKFDWRIILWIIGAVVVVGFISTGENHKSGLLGEFFSSLPKQIASIFSGDKNAGSAGTGRWELWQLTMDKIKERPGLGWGIEGVQDYLADNTAEHTQRTHNEYLQYASFFGVPAIICYIGGIFAVFWHGFKRREYLTPIELAALAGAFAYAVNAFVGVSMFYTAPQFYVLLGLGMSRGVNIINRKTRKTLAFEKTLQEKKIEAEKVVEEISSDIADIESAKQSATRKVNPNAENTDSNSSGLSENIQIDPLTGNFVVTVDKPVENSAENPDQELAVEKAEELTQKLTEKIKENTANQEKNEKTPQDPEKVKELQQKVSQNLKSIKSLMDMKNSEKK